MNTNISQTQNETHEEIHEIFERKQKSLGIFKKYIHKPEIAKLKEKVHEIVQAYPPKMRPFVMTWIIVAYLSIIPLAGTTSLLFWGSIGKYLSSRKK